MVTASARAIRSAGGSFEAIDIERRAVGPRDVLLEVAYSGVCHSDIHNVRSASRSAYYPQVPGHEVAGVVSAVGAEVTKFAVGDRAGVGVMVDSCRQCSSCKAGMEQFCRAGFVKAYNSKLPDGTITQGGYSSRLVVDQDFAVTIPDQIDLARAAPLLCAGITLYSPLKHWQAGPGKRVAILGFGGLGHVGVKISKAFGAHTTVLDLSLDKKADGVRFGADEYLAVTEAGVLESLESSFDLIISTVPAHIDLDTYVGLLDIDGTFVNVGASEQPLSVSTYALRANRRSVAGTLIGGIHETQEMLNFCGEHGIGAEVEVIGADQIDTAFDRVVTGDVRYRFVIDGTTFTGGPR